MTITIQSPVNGTHYTSAVPASFFAESNWPFSITDDPSAEWQRAFFFVIDGQDLSAGIRIPREQLNWNTTGSKNQFAGQTTLTNLSSGSHTVTVYWGAIVNFGTPAEMIVYNSTWSATNQFYVDSQAETINGFSVITSNLPLIFGCLAVVVIAAFILAVYRIKLKAKQSASPLIAE